MLLPKGVGVWLADDLARSSSEVRRFGSVRHTALPLFAAGARQIASKLAPTACGQNQEQSAVDADAV